MTSITYEAVDPAFESAVRARLESIEAALLAASEGRTPSTERPSSWS